MSRFPKFLWILSVTSFAVYFVTAYTRLPDQFATHFGFDGQPNAWSSKPQFYLTFGVAAVVTQGLVAAIYQFLEKMPNAINWPNKDHWLATPERRVVFFHRVRTMLAITGAFMGAVFFLVMNLVVQEAGVGIGAPVPFNLVMGLIAVGAIVFFAWTLRYSRKIT